MDCEGLGGAVLLVVVVVVVVVVVDGLGADRGSIAFSRTSFLQRVKGK
jgi:hypothetical protein